jgi:hypothetical protein
MQAPAFLTSAGPFSSPILIRLTSTSDSIAADYSKSEEEGIYYRLASKILDRSLFGPKNA